MHERGLWCSTQVTRIGFFFGTRRGSLNCLSGSQCASKRRHNWYDRSRKSKKQKPKKQNQKNQQHHYFRTLPFVDIWQVILEELWNNVIFWFWLFWFLNFVKWKGLVFHRVLVTATPLSARVDSDVVEEEDLNCAKRSGRVRPPNRRVIVMTPSNNRRKPTARCSQQ